MLCAGHLCVLFFTVLTAITRVSSKQVVLVSTAADPSKWFWERKPYHGWTRLTDPTRYKACDATSLTQSDPQPNNWLIRNVQITVNEANRIDITVEYRITGCSVLPNNGGYYCDEKFGVYVNQSNQRLADPTHYPNPLSNPAAYENVAEISKPINSQTSVTINSLVKGKYFILAFQNSGACTFLYSMRVSYNVCPGETHKDSLVTLPRTVAPANDSVSIPVEGNCEKDTVHTQGSLFAHCKSNGEWDSSGFEGKCICKEDMQNVGGKCQTCQDGMYNDQSGLNCTILPSAPRDVNTTFVNQSAVKITWLPPLVTGDTSHVFYKVDCKICSLNDENKCVEESCGSDVSYIPNKEDLNVTQVIVANLLSFMNYTFKVYAMNRVSEVAKRKHGVKENYTIITTRTKGTIPGKPEVSVEQKKDAVLVSWTLEQKNGIIQGYHVTYVRKDDSSDSNTFTTKKMEQQFEDLKAGETYEFQVFAENNYGRGPAGVRTLTLSNGLTVNHYELK